MHPNFLVKLYGYSQSLIKKLAGGGSFNDEDYTNLEKINDVSDNLNNTMKDIYTELSSGRLKWDEVEKVASKNLNQDENKLEISSVTSIKDSLEDYEGLIYDGAYSSHIETSNPKNLLGSGVSVETAANKVRECVEKIYQESKSKKEIEEIIYNGESNGNIDIYNFEVRLKNTDYTIDVDISKQDGKLVLLMSDREVTKQNIDIDKAKEIGDSYLKSLGLEEFTPTYYSTIDNMVTINYAAVQGNIIIYPDLIKVKIAQDTGEVCSVECTGYIFNHTVRTNIVPSLSKMQARLNVGDKLKIENVRLAIIPTDSKSEVLTYEFKGTVEDKTFLIYINAHTGVEEEVLLLLKVDGGELTI